MVVGKRAKTWGLLVLVNVFWAAQFPAYGVVSQTVGVAALNFWTFVIAAAVLWPVFWRERRQKRATGSQFQPANVWRFAVLAALGLIPPSILMAWGIAHSSASNASILSLTIPVLMVMMGMVMLSERPGRYVLVSLLLAVVGTVLMSWREISGGNFSSSMLVGDIAVFLSGAGAAFYNAYCKRLLARYSAVEVLFYGYLTAILMCAGLSIFLDDVPFYQVAGWSGTAWLGIVVLGAIVWGIAMLLWMSLLKELELGQISISVYMLPVFGLILSALTLHERIGMWQIIGGLIVLASAYMSSAPPKPPKSSSQVSPATST